MTDLTISEPPKKKTRSGSDEDGEANTTTTTPKPVEERAAELLENSEAEWDTATESVAKALTGL